MKRPTAQGIAGRTCHALQGEKDVAALPAPVEMVEVGIEGMRGRVLGGILVIDVGRKPHEEPQRTDVPVWKRAERDKVPVLLEIHPGDGIGEFRPASVHPLNGKSAEEHAAPGNGIRFAGPGFVAQGRRLDGFARNLGHDSKADLPGAQA